MQTMKPRRRLLAVVLMAAGAIFVSAGVQARWAMVTTPVPVERLVRNVTAFLQKNPRDARAYYVLGRLHSMAWASASGTIDVIPADKTSSLDNGPLPGFAGYQTIQIKPANQPDRLPADAMRHLKESIERYGRATELNPKSAIAFLGMGWMREQGAGWAAQIGPPSGEATSVKPLTPATKRMWQDRALAAYRRAYALSVESDLRQTGIGPGEDAAISLEGGKGIVRLLTARTPTATTAGEKTELARVRENVKTLRAKPRAVTPIVFPIHGDARLADLLDPNRRVRFDLAGDGRPARWPWVRPDTGILVWDPERTGRVTSGLQLFGSVTWWIAWTSGYDALAALDDNRDGWLTGGELRGLAVWRDRNGNGVSDRGEVVPLSTVGIAALSVRATTTQPDAVAANPRGLRRADGSFAPTYDWTPTSLPR